MIWFLLALGNAITNSAYQAYSNYAVSLKRYSKFSILFWSMASSSILLFAVSWVLGFPEIRAGFWPAVLTTSILNFIAAPILLKGYEIGEFSSVYSMILLTPVFVIVTAFIFLGEVPQMIGIFGIILTIIGLASLSGVTLKNYKEKWRFERGALLGAFVALIYSVTVNFDKLSAKHSDAFFAAAMTAGTIAVLNGVYLLFKYRGSLSVKDFGLKSSYFWYLLPLGIISALAQVLHNSALLIGLVSYTIAIKRIGIVFGVILGWIFFKEKDLGKKMLGATIAVCGVLLILLG
ncbi:hypothetical protein A2W54_00695 [Candidatus Giovannonibacteria bacterium RIFCSPHIGHO2_02_43_13]|uniref:EamA domain-containing protein n=1 Tax=Candidatus Giovannonibacteria bacterium RIFCSPHIGHO2_02_43_13 TaxID=1798330 RepID=A0A1F5WV44_9BACT|nr:MAG: hypothetical protein UW28_C0006G0015 [Parcubacteria group bacterium GW2011_GWA2_44_13]OGF73858.1 MAG: hypothetical protein A3E06_02045 [Candidatus Giovannonibacteria bacterium RIFCSPHIGHO2_12_FULL_44_42]OGF79161.1 MAG: hypothetical protein A2W54_00695 [Candidatus Giovannonibacteria bacterium RIFCSPHIGHO2_02_43_13]OGF90291.1 MAG: hypothetical protein A3I94_03210 [Candidatus Giovannonibacteria bacterium RIFCSPLOWO2_02_FULL_43_54]OGF97514.1 MAG: hypothetical protein A3H08_00095 [Candidatus